MSIDPASALMAMDAAAGEAPADPAPGALSPVDDGNGARSPVSQPRSQTALDFIGNQEALEAEARDVLPYSFDTCTKDMGPLRQNLYACLTCNPPPPPAAAGADASGYTPAGVCYACSISCHGEHELVELFTRRHFVCDCGTTRLPATSECTLRVDPATEQKGVHSEEPAATNTYNKNFRNRFCDCNEFYDANDQKGTMFQCIGLATEQEGGCGEDWWHPECLMGLSRDWFQKIKKEKEAQVKKEEGEGGADGVDKMQTDGEAGTAEPAEEHPVPPGFPDEENFDHLVCYKCVESAPFLKRYANYEGFIPLKRNLGATNEEVLSAVKAEPTVQAACEPKTTQTGQEQTQLSRKRSRDETDEQQQQQGGLEPPAVKRARSENPDAAPSSSSTAGETIISACKLIDLPPAPTEVISLLLPEQFREKMCRCRDHYPDLRPYPMLLEEEETYEPPISENGDGANGGGDGGGSVGTGSLLERGEAALSSVDRVRAIEGVMVYNQLKEKVKDFLKPFADTGKMVSAEEIKAYFEKLRGDDEAIRAARTGQGGRGGGEDERDDGGEGGDSRREQNGY